MQMPSDPNAKWRVRIAFLSLFVVFSAGAYFVVELGKLREGMAARERQTALQAATDAKPIGESLRQHPQNKFLLLIAMATKAADETDAALETLSNDIASPGIAKTIDFFGTASPSDLEALRRDLKAAEANATTSLPRYTALLKAERDNVEKYALAHADKDTTARFLENIDRRHAEITALTSSMLSARADFYRAYENYVAFLVGEIGRFKVDKGQFLFPLQFTVNRYNVVAQAMTVAANRIAELDQEGKSLRTSQQERWTQFINGQ
jgi:hypothetical protein